MKDELLALHREWIALNRYAAPAPSGSEYRWQGVPLDALTTAELAAAVERMREQVDMQRKSNERVDQMKTRFSEARAQADLTEPPSRA